jgi:ribosome-associated protein
MTKKKDQAESLSTQKKVALKKTPVKKKVVKKKAVKSEEELLVDAGVDGMQEIKAERITILDLRKIENRVSDYYIICQAETTIQVNAIVHSIETVAKKKLKEIPFFVEGRQNAEWVLVDYVNVVAHVFQTEAREFYDLESLWADAEITHINID